VSALSAFQPIADLWERADRKVSLKQWVSNGESPLILARNYRSDEGVAAINRILLHQIASSVLAEPESATGSRFWFLFDDLNGAGRLNSLLPLLNARSKGVRCALVLPTLMDSEKIIANKPQWTKSLPAAPQ